MNDINSRSGQPRSVKALWRSQVAPALALTALLATLLSLVITLWEWLENPGGIFRSAQGVRWDRLWETALSWWWPSCLVLLPLCLAVLVLYRWFFQRLTRTAPKEL